MIINQKKGIVLIQITEFTIKVIKYAAPGAAGNSFISAASEQLPVGSNDSVVITHLKGIFKKIGYNKEKVIISLACHQATHRYIKVPTRIPQEIEQIIAFQAPKYLPYAASELVTGYHLIRVDQEGYAHVNLIIVPLESSQRYCTFLKEVAATDFTITLSSYGLAYLYDEIVPKQSQPVLVIDIDAMQIELAIVQAKEVLLSRSLDRKSVV